MLDNVHNRRIYSVRNLAKWNRELLEAIFINFGCCGIHIPDIVRSISHFVSFFIKKKKMCMLVIQDNKVIYSWTHLPTILQLQNAPTSEVSSACHFDQ